MKHTIQTTLGVALVLAGALSSAQAALLTRLDGQAVYDNDFNITWLANASLAATQHFGVGGIDANGRMDWNTAQNWIGAMNDANYLGYNDWRLPTTLQPDASCSAHYGVTNYGYAYNCTGSEMGHLFYEELGGTASQPIAATHNANFSLFQNIQSDYTWGGHYWASAYGDGYNAWDFSFTHGDQNVYGMINSMSVFVLRGGDSALTAPSSVPVPAAAWLFGSGLLGLIGAARRKAA